MRFEKAASHYEGRAVIHAGAPPAAVFGTPVPDIPSLVLLAENCPQRPALENYIAQRFEKEYQAHINHFMPYLLALQDGDEYHAALGFRLAAEDPLFLETYLDKPAEEALANIAELDIARQSLVEVGNLAGTKPGSSAPLFCGLAQFLDTQGFEWVVICATPTVQNIFSRLGIPLLALAEAHRDALPPDQQTLWGSYYDCRPLVMAVHVKTAHRCMRASRLGARCLRDLEPSLQGIAQQWQQVQRGQNLNAKNTLD